MKSGPATGPCVAVLPARGGSKRIPRKNLRDFCGMPMLSWPITTALESRCFDRVIVSTDDEEIAQVARGLGAEVPFLRPTELADDYTPTLPVIVHAIETLTDQGVEPAMVCCLYPTAAFVQAEDLRRGMEILLAEGCDYAVSVTDYAYPVQRALRVTEAGRIAMALPEYLATRSQDLPLRLHDAGQFYWGRTAAWTAGKALLSDAAAPVLLPRHRVQDIDTEQDWERAEWLFRAMRAVGQ
jgi:pseudaminic acid cytidylyltransferase